MKHYSITIKCNYKGIGETENEIGGVYSKVLSYTKGVDLVHSYEKDTKGKLHLHGYFKSSKRFRYIDLKKTGWNIYLRRVYEHTGWYTYLMKDISSHNEPTIQERVQQGEYLFVPEA